MGFDSLSRKQKIQFWQDIEKDIKYCLTACGTSVPHKNY